MGSIEYLILEIYKNLFDFKDSCAWFDSLHLILRLYCIPFGFFWMGIVSCLLLSSSNKDFVNSSSLASS